MLRVSKKVIFRIILFILPLFLLFVLEICLRILHVGYNLSLFTISKSNSDYFEINPQVTRRYFYKSPGTEPYPEMFLRVKPDSCFRIFVLGESSAQGFPYRRNGSFPCMLQYLLQKSYPHKRIEVVNVSMAAINSFALADFIDEIVDKDPDLIIVYAGHNEFYGALGVASAELGSVPRLVKLIHLHLVNFRIYQALQNIARKFSKVSIREEGTLMHRIAQKSAIEYGSKQYNLGIQQFEKNMGQLLLKTKARNIPVILSTLISNINDLPPLSSNKASDSAHEFYKKAKSLEVKGNYEEAKKLLYLAKDMDAIRFRAPEDMNEIIIKLSRKFAYPLIDIKSVFESNSPHQLIGNNLIIDHLHPNIDGYKLMAYTFYQFIVSNYLTDGLDYQFSFESFKQSYSISQFDSAYANFSVEVLKSDWPFTDFGKNRLINTRKPRTYLDSLILKTFRNLTPVEQSQYQFATHQMLLGNNASAMDEFKSLIVKFPYHAVFYIYLSNLYEKNEQLDEAIQILEKFPDKHKNAEILENIIRLQIRKHDYQSAITTVRQIEKLNLSLDFAKRIDAYKKAIGNQDRKTFFRSIIVDPKAKQYLDEASQLITAKNYDAALIELQHSLRIQDTYIAHFFIGSILLRKGMYDEALVELQRAYRFEKNDPQLLNNLILVNIKLNRYNESMKLLALYKQINPFDTAKIKKLEWLIHTQIP